MNEQVRQHPWAMFLGATAIGFIGTRLLHAAAGSSAAGPTMPAMGISSTTTPVPDRHHGRHGHSKHPTNGKNSTAHAAESPSLLGKIAAHYGDELAKLQGLALGAVAAVVREMVVSSASSELGEHISQIVDGVTEKLGGTPLHGALFQKPYASAAKEDNADNAHEVIVDRPMGAAPNRGGVGLG